MARKTDDELAVGREIRRGKAEARAVDKLDAQLDAADALIGKLVREGRTVLYINLLPLHRGKTLEGSRQELISYLIRNRYI
jgi:hypothetical protein